MMMEFSFTFYDFLLCVVQEYDHQGRVETAKALRELRIYCKKQEDMWSTISELKSPKRSVSRVEGEGNHLCQVL